MNGNHDGRDQGPLSGPVDALHCVNPQCGRRVGMLRAEIDRLNVGIQALEIENQAKTVENRRAADENERLRRRLARIGKHTERTWPEELRRYLRNSHPNKVQYAKIHRLCCKEENMSSRKELVHPDLKLMGPDWKGHDDSDSESDVSDVDNGEASEVASEVNSTQTVRGEKPFPFEKLPWELQARVLKLDLHKPGKIIHCISRLDPFVQPEEFPSDEDLGENKSGLMHRFFWGKRELNLSRDGVKPNDVLGILTVSKRFYFLGVHIFYGLNTFAFSSLGELGRFCQGSGLARVARFQHIEFFLTGNQYLTAPPDTRMKVPFSRRSFPMSWLADMYRLKTLVIHVNETGKSYIRRGYENPQIKKFLAAKTAGQPNQRMSRSLRCIQGLDYVYQLRGLEWIRLYDFNKVLQAGRSVRKSVQDWSFVEDVTNTTTMPKPPKRAECSELKNLEPLFRGEGQNWTPGPTDWELVESVFIDSNGRCSYDDLRIQKKNRDADVASYLSVTGTAPVIDISSSSSASPSSDDDSDGPSGPDRPLGLGQSALSSWRERQRLKSRLFVSNEDSELDSDSDSKSSLATESSTELSSDSDSESSSSDSDTAIGSHRSFDEILSAHLPSRAPSAALSQSPIRSDLPLNPAPETPTAPKRRESTASGLFVTPGPARTASASASASASTTPNQPPTPHTPDPTNNNNTRASPPASTAAASSQTKRESTTPGLFVTPGPSGPLDDDDDDGGGGGGGGEGGNGEGAAALGEMMVEELSSLGSDEEVTSSSSSSSSSGESSSEESDEEESDDGLSSDSDGEGDDSSGWDGPEGRNGGSSNSGGGGGRMGSLFSGSDADAGSDGDDEGVGGKGWLARLGRGGHRQRKRSRSWVSRGDPSKGKRPRVGK